MPNAETDKYIAINKLHLCDYEADNGVNITTQKRTNLKKVKYQTNELMDCI